MLTIDEFKKVKSDGRVIALSAPLDSTCYFLTPNCNECTHQAHESKKCLYNLHTEKCYVCDSLLKLQTDADESLGRPEFWQVSEMNLDIHYDRIYRGKFGRSIFTDRKNAVEMADRFRFCEGEPKDFDYTYYIDNLTYDDYIKLEKKERVVILPCKPGEKFYIVDPDCTGCKYKNDGYKGCGFIPKEGESPYTCNYNHEIDMCYVFDQSKGNTFYVQPEAYFLCLILLTIYSGKHILVFVQIEMQKDNII